MKTRKERRKTTKTKKRDVYKRKTDGKRERPNIGTSNRKTYANDGHYLKEKADLEEQEKQQGGVTGGIKLARKREKPRQKDKK